MIKFCKTCEYWKKDEDDRDDNIITPLDPDTYEPMEGIIEVRYCKSPLLSFYERPIVENGATVIDGSEYYGKLITASKFSCGNHKQKEKKMNLKKFIEESSKTAIYPHKGEFEGLGYVIMGLCGETGEVFEVLKKIYRDNDNHFTEGSKQRLLAEVSDCMWYVSQVFKELKSESQSFSAELSRVQESAYESFIDTKEYLIKDKMTQQKLILIKVHNLCNDILNLYSNIEINGCSKEDDYFNQISNKNYHIFVTLLIFLKNIEIDINDVLSYNLRKLKERQKANKLQGSGEKVEKR